MQQAHVCLIDRAPSLAVIAARTGRHQVFPGVFPSKMAWDNMVNS
jgi:hypothetical protein